MGAHGVALLTPAKARMEFGEHTYEKKGLYISAVDVQLPMAFVFVSMVDFQ